MPQWYNRNPAPANRDMPSERSETADWCLADVTKVTGDIHLKPGVDYRGLGWFVPESPILIIRGEIWSGTLVGIDAQPRLSGNVRGLLIQSETSQNAHCLTGAALTISNILAFWVKSRWLCQYSTEQHHSSRWKRRVYELTLVEETVNILALEANVS